MMSGVRFLTIVDKKRQPTWGLASVGRDQRTINFYHKSTFDPAAE